MVWITGGSAGIGAACADVLAREGARVAVSARRVERLEEVVSRLEAHGVEALAVPCDVTDAQACVDAVATIAERFGQLDAALANAGFGVTGRVGELSDADWRRQFDVNLFGVVNTLRAALPAVEAQGGRLGLVGSVAGFVCPKKNAPYSASKAAALAVGRTLSAELHGTPTTCTTFLPGFVESEIGRVDNEGVFHGDKRDKRPAALMWRTEDAAEVMVRAWARRRREVIFTGHGRLLAGLSRLSPGLTFALAARYT